MALMMIVIIDKISSSYALVGGPMSTEPISGVILHDGL